MRNLVITRHKTTVGSATPLKVYVADPEGIENINGTACFWMGDIENGETAAFPIDENEAQIFIVAENGRNRPCEYCIVPAGTVDVYISGRCLFKPLDGNPFHFDGNQFPKTTKRHWIAALVAVACLIASFLLVDYLLPDLNTVDKKYDPKTFSAEGMQITLTDGFREEDVTQYGFTLGYASSSTAVYVLKEEFYLSEGFGDLTLEQYVQMVISNNQNLAGKSATQENGLTILEYTADNPNDGKTYSYLIAFFKGPDAFWMFEFSTLEENADGLRQTYLGYAGSVCFPGAAI